MEEYNVRTFVLYNRHHLFVEQFSSYQTEALLLERVPLPLLQPLAATIHSVMFLCEYDYSGHVV